MSHHKVRACLVRDQRGPSGCPDLRLGIAQSIQNSLPSMSSMGMHESLPSYSVCTCTAPSGTSRAHSASSAARRSLPTSPVPTRTSRCTRFLTAFPSGTRWKYSRGPTPEGSMQANHASRCSGDCERLKSSQVANPSGGGGTTYPNTSHQKRARRSGSAQSKVTWNFLIAGIDAQYQGTWDSAAHFARRIRPHPVGPRAALATK